MEPQPRCLQTRDSFQPPSNTSTVFNRVGGFFATCIIFCKLFPAVPAALAGKAFPPRAKETAIFNCPCLSALSAQVPDGGASFAAPGVPQRVVCPLPGDGGRDLGTVPGHAAGGDGPARSSLARARSTPKAWSGCWAAGTHHSHQISGSTTSVPLQTPMKSSSKAANSSWISGFGLTPCPLLGMPKGSNPGIKLSCFPADGTARDLGPEED